MELGTFEPRAAVEGDRLQAKEAVDRPLVVLVREHRTGIVTQYNPPPGGEGVAVDVADINTGEVWINVLWMNGAVVDNLSPYVGKPVPIKLKWTPSAKGGNAYIGVTALEGDELARAGQWAAANPTRFDQERVLRAQQQGQQQGQQQAQQPQPQAQQQAAPPAAQPAQPAAQPAPAAQQPAPPAPAQQPAPAAPAPAPAAPAAKPGQPGQPLNPNDPHVQALLAQINGGNPPPPAQ